MIASTSYAQFKNKIKHDDLKYLPEPIEEVFVHVDTLEEMDFRKAAAEYRHLFPFPKEANAPKMTNTSTSAQCGRDSKMPRLMPRLDPSTPQAPAKSPFRMESSGGAPSRNGAVSAPRPAGSPPLNPSAPSRSPFRL